MNRTKEIILTNPAYHTMEHNGYINTDSTIADLCIGEIKIVIIKFNKEYFN